MTEVELKKIKKILLQLREELQQVEETLRETSDPVELDQTRVGRLSRMDAMQSQQMALETVRRRKDDLVKIETALRRIESGEYGYCVVCDEEIDIRRLMVSPASLCCIDCADK